MFALQPSHYQRAVLNTWILFRSHAYKQSCASRSYYYILENPTHERLHSRTFYPLFPIEKDLERGSSSLSESDEVHRPDATRGRQYIYVGRSKRRKTRFERNKSTRNATRLHIHYTYYNMMPHFSSARYI